MGIVNTLWKQKGWKSQLCQYLYSSGYQCPQHCMSLLETSGIT